MFPHRNLHKYSWTYPDGKTHNQIYHVLINRRWRSSVLDVRSFRGVYCNNGHYLVVAKVRERLTVSQQAAQNFDSERFNLRKLNELEVRKQYQIKISWRFAALENLNISGDINTEINITLQLFLYAGDANILGRCVHTNKNPEFLVVSSKETGLK